MKTPLHTQSIMVALAAALASCAQPPEPTRMAVSASLRPSSSLSGRLHQEVNAYRISQGASPLQRHAGLDRLAQDHCEYLRQHRGTFRLHGRNVSHFGFDARSVIARQRYQMGNISENVAASSKVPGSTTQRMMALWTGSKDHNRNMLDDWTHTGVGVVVDSDGMIFATQIFSTMNMSPLSARDRFNNF
jgi:uncharacterized protein YkwD